MVNSPIAGSKVVDYDSTETATCLKVNLRMINVTDMARLSTKPSQMMSARATLKVNGKMTEAMIMEHVNMEMGESTLANLRESIDTVLERSNTQMATCMRANTKMTRDMDMARSSTSQNLVINPSTSMKESG